MTPFLPARPRRPAREARVAIRTASIRGTPNATTISQRTIQRQRAARKFAFRIPGNTIPHGHFEISETIAAVRIPVAAIPSLTSSTVSNPLAPISTWIAGDGNVNSIRDHLSSHFGIGHDGAENARIAVREGPHRIVGVHGVSRSCANGRSSLIVVRIRVSHSPPRFRRRLPTRSIPVASRQFRRERQNLYQAVGCFEQSIQNFHRRLHD